MHKRCPGCKQLRRWDPDDDGGEWYVRTRLLKAWGRGGIEGIERWEEVMVPSGYCRECTKRAVTEYRRRRRVIYEIERVLGLRTAVEVSVPDVERLPGERYAIAREAPKSKMKSGAGIGGTWPEEGEKKALAEKLVQCEVCEVKGFCDVVVRPHPGWLCRECRGILGNGRDRKRIIAMLGVVSAHNAKEKEQAEEWRGRMTGWDTKRVNWDEVSKRKEHQGNAMGRVAEHGRCVKLEERIRAVLVWSVKR
jgi:hypothetical protein